MKADEKKSENKKIINNHKQSTNLVDCSRLKSFYQSCRRYLHFNCSTTTSSPIDSHNTENPYFLNPVRRERLLPPLPQMDQPTSYHACPSNIYSLGNGVADVNHGNEIAEEYWRRASKLEEELKKLEEWLSKELQRRGCRDLCSGNVDGDYQDLSFKGVSTHRPNGSTQKRFNKVIRLEDGGGYLHVLDYKGFDGRLALQFSPLVVLPGEAAASDNISLILNEMATMGTDRLLKWLFEQIPLTSISPEDTQPTSDNTNLPAKNDVMESIFMGSISKLESLAVEGLQIQTGSKVLRKRDCYRYYDTTNIQRIATKNPNKDNTTCDDPKSFITVVLVLPLDTHKRYQRIHENPMIGLVEVGVSDASLHIQGVYVVGLSARKPNGDVSGCLWCIS